MKKMLTLRAIQAVKGDAAATQEILKALRKTKGNMREACALLGVGKSSMYRLIADLNAADEVAKLVEQLAAKQTGKPVKRTRVPEKTTPPPAAQPRMRVKKVA